MVTPIRKQYLDLKRKHPGTILFFRLGDFYETFDDDAELVARELEIALTSKPFGKGERVPLAGVPHQSLETHVARLVRAGHRVAVCEQLADPAEVKGIVPRDVVRVVTAGTVTSEEALAAGAPNYLAALAGRGGEVAVALADITTGEVRLVAGPEARPELARSSPAEILVDDPELAGDLEPGGPPVTECERLGPAALEGLLAERHGDQGMDALVDGPASRAALGMLYAYLEETFPAALRSLQRVRHDPESEVCQVDAHTLRNLDVLPGTARAPSLLGLLDQAQTAMGARLLRAWLTRPLRDAGGLAARQDAVEWAVREAITRTRLRSGLKGVPDVERILARVGSRTAGPRDLFALREGLEQARAAGEDLGGQGEIPALLGAATGRIALAGPAAACLQQALASEPAGSFGDGAVIRAGFSPEIDSLRETARDARRFLVDLEQREREETGIRSLKVGHNRVFGYYIEVSNANAGGVPAHYERRQTLVGAERYVTPELKEHESHLANARTRLGELEERAFGQLVETVAAELEGLRSATAALAEVDLLLALGEVAAERGYVRPTFNAEGRVAIEGGRHPVVEGALGAGSFVPNDCRMDDECQVVLLTGPNMSGKSTFLRQVALIAIMAQAGSFVPAERADLPLFDRVFSRIGAQDDLASGRSTFMVEMRETAQILHQATADSLVILDEVGRGTSTYDGMAIARAVVEFLHNRAEARAKTLFATHYHELTELADLLPRVQNYRVAVTEAGGEVVFEHRVMPGSVDRSYGVHVARLAGLPGAVVHRAEELLEGMERGGERTARNGVGDSVQLAFFEPGRSAIDEAVRALDIDSLTPLEAIQKLYELRALAGDDAAP